MVLPADDVHIAKILICLFLAQILPLLAQLGCVMCCHALLHLPASYLCPLADAVSMRSCSVQNASLEIGLRLSG